MEEVLNIGKVSGFDARNFNSMMPCALFCHYFILSLSYMFNHSKLKDNRRGSNTV
jgi:hypothetical protein